MKPLTNIAFICAVLCALPAAGQEDEITDFAELDLEELLDVSVYSAAKHEQDIAESPSAISVITREQIENSHCTDLICLLRRVPEVDVERVVPMNAAAGARSLTDALGDKVLLLVDGLEINDEIFGIILWQTLPVHMQDIERIEVIRGPGSALYGANAHSLVVSITTRKAGEDLAEVFLGGGEHDRSSLHLRLGQKYGDWRLQLSGGIDTEENWRLRGQREREAGRARLLLDRQSSLGQSRLVLEFISGTGLFYTAIANAQVSDSYRASALLAHQTEMIKAQLSFSFYDADASWDLPMYFGETKLGEPPDKFSFFSSTLDGEVQVTWSPFDGNLWIVGANYRWITFVSDQNQPSENHQHRVGLFLHNEQRLAERLVVTLGVRFDYNNITPFTISPRVAGVWQVQDEHFVRLAAGQAFHKPSFLNTSLHIKGVETEPGFEGLADFFLNNIGNESVGNESITTIEAGYTSRYFRKRLVAELVAFYNRYRDAIVAFGTTYTNEYGLPDLGRSTLKFSNEGREVDALGGSVALTWILTGALKTSVNYTYRYSWYISEPKDPAGATLGAGKGDRVPWVPIHLFNAWVQYVPESGLRAGLSVHARSSSTMDRLEHGSLFDDHVALDNPALWMLGGFAAWRERIGPGWLELGVRAFNVLNFGFRDNMAITRPDGTELGGELMGRRIFLFLRGSI